MTPTSVNSGTSFGESLAGGGGSGFAHSLSPSASASTSTSGSASCSVRAFPSLGRPAQAMNFGGLGGCSPGVNAVSQMRSIWSDRPTAAPLFSASSPRRARAGTLPSRLPAIGTARDVGDQLGSLALLSPTDNEAIWDAPRWPEQAAQGVTSPTPQSQSAPVRTPTSESAPLVRPPVAHQPAVSPIVPSSSTANQTRSRSRSGSLNSASSYSPFGPSIWSVDRKREDVSIPAAGSPVDDSLRPYYPSQRLRSYTLNTVPLFDTSPAAIQASLSGENFLGRTRAHTMAHMLGRYSQDVVSIDDLSPVPTASLWVTNVPATVTPYSINALFGSFGTIEVVHVLPLKQCACITYATVQNALEAQARTNGKDLFNGTGPSFVGFAKPAAVAAAVSAASGAPPLPAAPSVPVAVQPAAPVRAPAPHPAEFLERFVYFLKLFEASPAEIAASVASAKRGFAFTDVKHEIGRPPELAERVYMNALLRVIRKKIDNQQMNESEIKLTAINMLNELAVLASDHMGNTVVQQLFEHSSEDVKDMMVRELAPHLAQTGVHKNGTWAAQKVIDLAHTARQKHMIVKALRPYAVPLFLDQFGNYVIQGCLKFGAPWSDFVFETIVARMDSIAFGRFSARAIRTCLESNNATSAQQRMVAAAIAARAPYLFENSNSALLVTWLLESYTSPSRYTAVSTQLLPCLISMCVSKVGSVTILKIIANRVDPAAGRMLLNALFEPQNEAPNETLERILADSQNGQSFIYKLLSGPLADTSPDRDLALAKVRAVLARQPALGAYPRLLEEIGMPHNESSVQPRARSRSFLQSMAPSASYQPDSLASVNLPYTQHWLKPY